MYVPRLKHKYFNAVAHQLKDKFNYRSIMEVPRLLKISLNQGLGAAVTNSKLIDLGIAEMTAIAGQKAFKRKAKKSVSNFKLREGMPIGVSVTLRGNIMYDFLDRFISISLPRVRDFRGLKPNCFDGLGNCTIGIKEQIIFPEISMDKVSRLTGMNVTLVTTSSTDDVAFEFLKAMGLPFKRNQ